jgi:hypothetical protein
MDLMNKMTKRVIIMDTNFKKICTLVAVIFTPCLYAQELSSAPWLDPDRAELWQSNASVFLPKKLEIFSSMDTTSRSVVRNFYNQYYALPMPTMNWTGSISLCNAGTISTEFKEWTISRVNFIRALAGLPGNITLNAVNSAKAQQAALMMAAQQDLNHFPPSTWACYTAEGAEAARNSNIHLAFGSSSFDDVVPSYMDDSGSNNYVVGHRRWILYPPQIEMGVGSTPTGLQWGGNALWVLSGFGTRPPTPNGTAWPPHGFVPLVLFPASNRWSFSYPSANFSSAAVTMNQDGSPVGLAVVSRTDNGYGDNTIVWEPTIKLAKNVRYDISINGVSGSGVPASFSYTVQSFDPADPVSVAASPTPASLNTVQNFFIGFYNRPADPGGLVYWANRLDTRGGSLVDIIPAFAASPEAAALFGPINSGTISTVVSGFYQAAFGRGPDAVGLAFYVNGFNAGTFTPASIIINILNGAQGTDLQTINNKQAAANFFTLAIDPLLNGNLQATYDAADIAAARTFLSGISFNPATAKTAADAKQYVINNIANPGDLILNPSKLNLGLRQK